MVGMGILTIRRGEDTFVSEVFPKDYFNTLLPVLMIEGADLVEMLEFRAVVEIERQICCPEQIKKISTDWTKPYPT